MEDKESQLRKGAVELVQKWRKICRNTRSRGFESETYAACARDLMELLAFTTELPNEDSYVEALMEAAKHEGGYKQVAFRALLRTYRFALFAPSAVADIRGDAFALTRIGPTPKEPRGAE
jgi:hypothetical protein